MTSETNHELQAFALQLTELKGQINAMQQQQGAHIAATNQQLSQITTRVEQIGNKLEAVSGLNHTANAHDDQLRRMWAQMEKQNARIEDAVNSSRKIFNIGIGAGFMLALMVSLVAWIYTTDRSSDADSHRLLRTGIEQNDTRLDRLEVWGAGQKENPYKR